MAMQTNLLLSAAELAAREIRDRIRAGDLKPGERISSDEISQQLGISKTPVRDALQNLRQEGLVEIQARVGAFVRQITMREIKEVYSLKSAVEPLAAAWAAEHGTLADRQRLSVAMTNLELAAAEDNVDGGVESVDAIHDLIFDMADSEVMRDVYRVFRARVRTLRQINLAQPGRLSVSAQHHRKIVDAICAGDPAAAAAMAEHLADATEAVKNVLTTDGD
ncbi:GntR family transcriptional regulator [uncultured Arthrobacter sp.]|uniref:GntR family transcriptional regulator n=1 Tax=uncultured Arthrobacter sp. TaxID=114050 RepID=UPI002615590A|nr:GntR family transcriptional regulator [uncultured Arthrobacter sp.]